MGEMGGWVLRSYELGIGKGQIWGFFVLGIRS